MHEFLGPQRLLKIPQERFQQPIELLPLVFGQPLNQAMLGCHMSVDGSVDDLPSTLKACVGDVVDTEQVAEAMRGHDLAISALRPPEGQEDSLVRLTGSVLTAAAQAGLRIMVVGGAASLKVPGQNGHTVLTAPGFLPADVVPIARACQAQQDHCRADDRADWTYLCPPGLLTPGQRTGQYRVGSDTPLVDAAGNAAILMEDFAVALLDETEAPHHKRSRFTVANEGGLVRGVRQERKKSPYCAWPIPFGVNVFSSGDHSWPGGR